MTTTRRHFFKILAGLPLVAAFARATPAAPNPQLSPAPLLLNRFSIAGFQYYDGPEMIRRLRPGTSCILTREPHNPHDRFAVEIHQGQAKLGYVPRSDNKHISRLLEQGARLTCRVVAVDPAAVVWQRARVEVWLQIYSSTS